jgi:hypothetical protein
MLSPIDARRLRDGARALELSSAAAPTSRDEIRQQLSSLYEGMVALQSLDDLGPEGNAKAAHDLQELGRRYRVLEERLATLEGKAP